MPADRPRAVLVDGYNVLHAIPRFAPRGDPLGPARQAFERWLAAAARRQGSPEVVLVWDGRGRAREPAAPGSLTVLYTRSGTTADERILELCRGRFAGRAGETWVVSSDRGVQEPARQLGFEVLGAMTFYRAWGRGGGEGRGGGRRGSGPSVRGSADKPLHASRAEVDELLEAFLEDEPDREQG